MGNPRESLMSIPNEERGATSTLLEAVSLETIGLVAVHLPPSWLSGQAGGLPQCVILVRRLRRAVVRSKGAGFHGREDVGGCSVGRRNGRREWWYWRRCREARVERRVESCRVRLNAASEGGAEGGRSAEAIERALRHASLLELYRARAHRETGGLREQRLRVEARRVLEGTRLERRRVLERRLRLEGWRRVARRTCRNEPVEASARGDERL